MGVQTHSCVSVSCDGCQIEATVVVDLGTAHYSSIDEARESLIGAYPHEPEYQWSVTDADEWLCPACTVAAACLASGGHDWGSWRDYGEESYRACTRAGCQATESRPIATVRLLDGGES